jgi:amino acid transporter
MHINDQMATIFALPGLFSTAFGFVYCFGKQIHSMSESALFPKFLSLSYSFNNGKSQSKYSALLFGSFSSFIVAIIVKYNNDEEFLLGFLFNVCILGAYFVYICIFITFIIFREKFSVLKRNFTNPFGIYGAIVGIIVFLISTIGVVGFQNDNSLAFVALLVYLVFMSIIYVLYTRKKQFFSPEEQRVMLAAYVIKGFF